MSLSAQSLAAALRRLKPVQLRLLAELENTRYRALVESLAEELEEIVGTPVYLELRRRLL